MACGSRTTLYDLSFFLKKYVSCKVTSVFNPVSFISSVFANCWCSNFPLLLLIYWLYYYKEKFSRFLLVVLLGWKRRGEWLVLQHNMLSLHLGQPCPIPVWLLALVVPVWLLPVHLVNSKKCLNYLPLTQQGTLDGIAGCWLSPGPAPAVGALGSEPLMEILSLLLWATLPF